MPATAQLNVRLDPELKKAGDRVLATHGLTPSQAIRSLYQSLTRNETQTLKLLHDDEGSSERKAERERKLKLHRDFHNELKKQYEALGIPYGVPHPSDWPSDKELLEEAIMERLREKDARSCV